MKRRVRFLMTGGFLGAGKTTTLGRLAMNFRQQGKSVVLVTNDQAADLVDTQLLRSQGFEVGEVAGACFCCSFDDLLSTLDRLNEDQHPDVILAEPVGSCTDLVSTVAQPLIQLYGDRFDVGPYSVILKPSHGRRILGGMPHGGFSPQAEYIFRKQLEEADLLLVNRIDELSAAVVDELVQMLEEQFPTTPILKISARTGEGFDPLLHALNQTDAVCRRILELDYDIYAAGEAELGWLNATYDLSAEQPFDVDQALLGLLEQIRGRIPSAAEIAHLKAIGVGDGCQAVVNLVSSDSPSSLSLPSHATVGSLRLIVNARIATDPAAISSAVDAAMDEIAATVSGTSRTVSSQFFRPGRPEPKHRMTVLGE